MSERESEREREREGVCVCVCETERERERVCKRECVSATPTNKQSYHVLLYSVCTNQRPAWQHVSIYVYIYVSIYVYIYVSSSLVLGLYKPKTSIAACIYLCIHICIYLCMHICIKFSCIRSVQTKDQHSSIHSSEYIHDMDA